MYVHTRSSSESKATALSVLISIFLLDFLKDFDIEDVLDDINLLFTRTSLDYIIKQENKDEQIFHLIWILQTMHDDQIREFLKKIEKYYDWIVRKIENEVKCHGDETIKYLIKLSSMQSKNHKHTKYNVHRTKEYIALRSALRKLKPHNSVVLLGGLSSGKKWLAYDVCSDFDVLKSMKFKIFWIDCSECISQEKDYEALKNLMYQLKHDHQFYNVNYTKENFIRLKEQIKCLFSEKENNECLLVLCNVQNNKCINAFNLECKRLIITRNRKVSDSMPTSLNKHLELNKGLTLNEFYLLIDKYKNANYDWRMDSIPLANDIYHMSLGEPCSLSIIAKHISQKKSNWIECMKNINNFEISNRKLKQEIEKSLEIFTPDELKLFATLSVFPRCAQIPVKLLAFLWNMRTYETEHFINKLHDHFFVQRVLLDDQETITCCVKFMYSSYIRNCNNIKSITDPLELHSRIVDFYEVKDHLNNRKDVDIDIYSYDGYFFHCIGFHLYRSSYKHLLPTLYTDFGFLGQKIRLVGLNDTIADLHTYSVEIASAERNFSLRKFENFLAKIEEKIKYFPDCCLLQYALFSTEDFIKELALKQVKKFPQRLWFTERNQYQQWRPIFNLPETAKLIRLLDDDLCIVVLSNHKVLLIDLTLGSKCCEMPLMKGINIVDMKIIDDYNHVLTQDCYGSLKLWNITEEKRCISKQRSNANFKPRLKDDTNKKFFHEQIISNYYNPSEKIQTFYVDPNNNRILVAFGGGLLMFFDWNKKDKKYKKSFENPYNVKIKTIHSVCLLNEKHYMIIYYKENNKIDVQFLKRKNTQLENLELKFPDNDKLIYHEVFQNYVIFVFQRYILRLNLIFDSFEKSNLEQLYENHDNIINCAKLLLDNQYLILGTQKGINVFDITKRSVTLQSIVSESISSIDNYDLDDDKYKSMIVCGCNHKNILYIFGLHLTNGSKLDWDHNPLRQNESDELASFEQIYTRYIGNKLFDVCEENDTLYAVDSKNRIHQICLSDTKKISILPSLDVQQNIIGIHCFKSKLIVAFNNGEIYDYLEKRLLVKANDVVEKDFFLKTMDNNILITSNANELTYFKHMQIEHSEKLLQTQTKYCKIIMNTHLLIINNCGAALIFDCEGFFKNPDKVNIVIGIKACNNLSSCDLKDNVLFLGFSQYAVHIYTLDKDSNGSISCLKRSEIPTVNSLRITCLAASNNKLLAIGLQNTTSEDLRSTGDIEIWKLIDDYKPQLMFCLKSHVKPINDLRFSPHNDVLISVAEQICFWNMNYVINNPLDLGNKKRHSSRFNSQKSMEEVDFKVNSKHQRLGGDNLLNLNYMLINSPEFKNNVVVLNNSLEQTITSDELLENNVFSASVEKDDGSNWSGLTGSSDKPELLSCLKLDGNEAQQIFIHKNFTQFSTIDDEGVYYSLKRFTMSSPEDTAEDEDKTDSSSSSVNLHPDVHRFSIDLSSNMPGTDVVDTANS